VFFSMVLLLLILAGLPFREDSGPPAAGPMPAVPPAPRGAAAFAAMAVLAAAGAAAGPAAARALDAGGAEPPSVLQVQLDAPRGCVAEAEGQRLRCGTVVVTARVVVFPSRANWSAVVAERRRLAGAGDVDATFAIDAPDGSARWNARQTPGAGSATAVATWLDGRPAGEGLRDRAAQAWNAAAGGGAIPVVAGIELTTEAAADSNLRRERDLLAQVLAAQAGGLVARVRELSRRR